MGRVEEKEGRMEGSEAGFTGFIGFSGLGRCLNRGLARITRISRIIGLVMAVDG